MATFDTTKQTTAELESILSEQPGLQLSTAAQLYNSDSDQAIIDINTAYCKARCAIQGAQLLEFETSGEALLWLSPKAVFDGKTAIRGGIPICLPWFGVNRYRGNLPKHGFARNIDWTLVNASADEREVNLQFRLSSSGHELFEHAFTAELEIVLSDCIEARINVINTESKAIPISFAFHSYLAVADSTKTQLQGCDGISYLDNSQQLLRLNQIGNITFTGEVDRVYENNQNPLYLLDTEARYQVESNLPTAIVWNPHKSGESITDIGSNWPKFVCVENGAAFANEILLQSGQQLRGRTIIRRDTLTDR